MKNIFFFVVFLTSFFFNCYQVKNIENVSTYKIQQPFVVREVATEKPTKTIVKSAISKWNRMLGNEYFIYEPSFLSVLRCSSSILIYDGSDTEVCKTNIGLLGYAIPRVLTKDLSKILGGKIYICDEQVKFYKKDPRFSKLSLDIERILIHELGHFLVIDHHKKSNLMNPRIQATSIPNKFDLEILIPTIKETNRYLFKK